MKRTVYVFIVPLILIGSIFLGCSGSHVKYIKENPDFLKPDLYARAFLEAWGQPDKVMAYQDFRDKPEIYPMLRYCDSDEQAHS